MELTVGITGASGALYAPRTLVPLAASGVVERVNLVMSEAAVLVAQGELGASLRGADVSLREGRTLVIVPRASFYNSLPLENLSRPARAGARFLPASPGFYHRP